MTSAGCRSMTGPRGMPKGGYTPAEQQWREWPRREAADRFTRGDGIKQIAQDQRVMLGRCGGGVRGRGELTALLAESVQNPSQMLTSETLFSRCVMR